jgi:hypothetical protein
MGEPAAAAADAASGGRVDVLVLGHGGGLLPGVLAWRWARRGGGDRVAGEERAMRPHTTLHFTCVEREHTVLLAAAYLHGSPAELSTASSCEWTFVEGDACAVLCPSSSSSRDGSSPSLGADQQFDVILVDLYSAGAVPTFLCEPLFLCALIDRLRRRRGASSATSRASAAIILLNVPASLTAPLLTVVKDAACSGAALAVDTDVTACDGGNAVVELRLRSDARN